MLRPATPLAVLLFVAFVFLLLSVLSTPIIKAIPLGSYNGYDYGVFGICKGLSCSGVKVGYTNQESTTDGTFTLPASTRHSLSAILVVHPIAAFLTLVCFILAVASHVHSAAHSSKFHLSLIILLLPTILITLLAFLIDILLFIPHLAWGGWLVLAATILLVISGVVTCAMRRMLVSRKARQRRIADNPDMNGQNTFQQSFGAKADSPPPLHQQPTAPMMNGGLAQEKPGFATFDSTNGRRMSEDDRVPLNSRTPSAPSVSSGMRTGYEDGLDRYGGPGRGSMGGMRGGRGGRMYNGPRDEFGNPLPPSGAFGVVPGRRSSSEQRLRHQYSGEAANPQVSRGRGRGGYPPRGYGRGGPFGPGRGGPGMPGNGRAGIPLGPMAAGAGAGMIAGEMMGRGQRGPPPGYGPGYPPQGQGGPPQYGPNDPSAAYGPAGSERRQSPGPPSGPGGYGYGARGPSPVSQNGQRYRQVSDPPPLPLQSDDPPGIGQAIEMDATTGSPQFTPGFDPAPPHQQLRESDSDVQGLVGLQQNRMGSPLRENPISPTSAYSQADYAPPRAAWTGVPGRNGTPPLQTNVPEGAPIELAARHSPPRIHTPNQIHSPAQARMSSDNYYEDVDPRFADSDPAANGPAPIPSLLMPGHVERPPSPPEHTMAYQSQPQQQHLNTNQGQRQYLEPSASYESFSEGSPAESDMTSISRRGVNPDWRPGQGHGPPGHQGYAPMPGPYNGNGGYGIGQGGVPNRRPMGPPQAM